MREGCSELLWSPAGISALSPGTFGDTPGTDSREEPGRAAASHLERCSHLEMSPQPGWGTGQHPVELAMPGCPRCPGLPVMRVPWGRLRGQAGTARRHFRQRRREQVGGACCAAAPAPGRAGGISSVISALYPFLPSPRSLQPEKSPDGCHSSPHTKPGWQRPGCFIPSPPGDSPMPEEASCGSGRGSALTQLHSHIPSSPRQLSQAPS